MLTYRDSGYPDRRRELRTYIQVTLVIAATVLALSLPGSAQALTLTAPADMTVVTDPNAAGAVVNYPAPIVTTVPADGAVTTVCAPASGSFFPVGTTLVTCTATNSSNSSVTASFNVTVNDTQPPNLTVPADIFVTGPNPAGAVVTYPAPIATDNVGVLLVACAPPSGSFFPTGNTIVTCTATDGAGNAASGTFHITVNDTQPPSITAPANITVANDPNQAGAIVNYPSPSVSDNAPGVTVACAPPSGSFYPIGTTVVTCTATDGSGNTASASFTVKVNDTQPPSITAPANITKGNDPNQLGAVVTYPPPTVSDNAPGVTASCVPPSGTFFALGTTTVTCTATDASNNTASASFTIKVVDVTPPAIGPVSDMILPLLCFGAACPVTVQLPKATDNVTGALSVVCSPASFVAVPFVPVAVTCTATDAAGNSASTSFRITPVVVIAPFLPAVAPTATPSATVSSTPAPSVVATSTPSASATSAPSTTTPTIVPATATSTVVAASPPPNTPAAPRTGSGAHAGTQDLPWPLAAGFALLLAAIGLASVRRL